VKVGDVTEAQDFDLSTAVRVATTPTTPAPGTPATPAAATPPSPFVTVNGIQNPSVTMELYRPATAADDLQFSSFGAWSTNNTAPNVMGGFGVVASGQDTPVGAMPTTGTATYSGATTGFLQVGTSAETRIRGTASVTANFASGNITSAFNIPNQFNVAGTANVVSGTNTYTGTTNTSSIANTGLPAAMTGDLRGAFYGPTAQETAGTWTLKGGTGATAAQAIGAFGAKK